MGVEADASNPSTGLEVDDAVRCSEVPVIICPPLAIDRDGVYNAKSVVKQKGLVFQVLDMLKATKPGDLVNFQVPVQMNLPKSQLQCYSEQVFCCKEKFLDLCADGATPLERFLAVVRWHISLVRPVPFAKAPYNPILGEIHHVTAGDLNVISEQVGPFVLDGAELAFLSSRKVSHHPPVSALFATNEKKKIEVLQWNFSVPKFYGHSVAVGVEGRRALTLLEHAETYETTSPKLTFRFFPSSLSEWTGDTVVRCAQSGLEAIVSFKPRPYFSRKGNQVSGKVFRTSSGKSLYTLSGNWDEKVMLESKGNSSVLYDGKAALTRLKTSVIADREAVSPMDSAVVWSKVTEGVWNCDWEAARAAKTNLEEAQRALRKQRSNAGETWKPKYFMKTDSGEWEWSLKGQPVPPGPITW